jgi:hypothetical protein
MRLQIMNQPAGSQRSRRRRPPCFRTDYARGRTRQISVRRERVEEVRRWLANYQKLKEKIEAICELNHDLLRPERAAVKPRKKRHD